MRLSGEEHLHAPFLEEAGQALGLAEEEIGALVGGGAPGKADGQRARVHAHPGAPCHLREELLLELAPRGAERAVARQCRGHARVLPGAHVDPVGDGDDGRGALHARPHLPRGLAVQLGHRIGPVGQAQPRHRHIERIAAQRAQLGGQEAAVRAEPVEIVERVRLVSRRHRGMSGEDDGGPHRLPRVFELMPRLHPVGDELEPGEHRMPLVEVVEVHRLVHGAEGAHAADTEQHLLGDAAVGAGVIEAAGDPQVARVGGLEEEERRDLVTRHAPHAALDFTGGHAHPHPRAGIGEEVGLVIVPLVHRLAVLADALGGVALGPAQSDADHRHPEVARRLHEVPGEDTETAGVRGELLVQPVLHREIRDEGHGRSNPPGSV